MYENGKVTRFLENSDFTNRESIARICVGDHMSYPREYGFINTHRLPKAVAIKWIKILGFTINLEESDDEWLNKLAIVISNTRTNVDALYNHDGSFFIIRRRTK